MRLIDITVTNFRAIGEPAVTVSLSGSDIIFLVGQNNTGKSAILTAYEYLVTPSQKVEVRDFHGFKPAKPIQINATFKKEPGDDKEFDEKGLNKWVDEDGLLRFQKLWVTPEVPGKKSTLDPSTGKFEEDGFKGLESHFKKHAPTPVRVPAMPDTSDLSKWVMATMKKTVLTQIDERAADKHAEILKHLRELEDVLLSEESLKRMSDSANESFQKVFPDLALSVGLAEGEEFDINKALEKEFKVTVKDSHFEKVDQSFEAQGHGVVRQAMFNFLGIVKETLESTSSEGERKDFLILFEEPEIYLHPQKIEMLRRALYELCSGSTFQILCASHNPELIDLSKPHTSIARLDRQLGHSVVVHQAGDDLFASDDERKKWVQMILRFKPHVCASFFADEVIIVEGDTEAIVLRELMSRLQGTKELQVVNSGSKNNIPFFQEVLTHFGIRQHIIHDSDGRYIVDAEGKVKRKKDGQPRNNSAWSLNATIWDWVVAANKTEDELARRYVFIPDFEKAHGYEPSEEKGKPLSAYEFAAELSEDSDALIVQFARQILGFAESDEKYTQKDLESLISKLEEE